MDDWRDSQGYFGNDGPGAGQGMPGGSGENNDSGAEKRRLVGAPEAIAKRRIVDALSPKHVAERIAAESEARRIAKRRIGRAPKRVSVSGSGARQTSAANARRMLADKSYDGSSTSYIASLAINPVTSEECGDGYGFESQHAALFCAGSSCVVDPVSA